MTDLDTHVTTSSTRLRVKTSISKDLLSATIILLKPEDFESDISTEEIKQALEQAGVSYGIDPSAIEVALDKSEYNQPCVVAKGDPCKKGNDTQFKYNFNVDQEKKPSEDAEGRIDYRDMNFIQNVEKDAVLVERIPPTVGVNGKGVDGSEIIAPRGRDLPLKRGDNTVESEDGSKLISTSNGSVVFSHGVVSVKDVAVIPGDVDFGVGNLDCLGSIKINGNVLPGFTVKAGGDIDIQGSVENCHIEASGKIIIKGGCRGSEEAGFIKAGGDIIVKYAEGARIESGSNINVGGELINSQIIAKDKVIVEGRRGMIVGGDVKAGKEIRASILGSDAGTATNLHVAYNATLMEKYNNICQEEKRLVSDGLRVKESLVSLYRMQMDRALGKDKEAVLKKLEEFQKHLPEEIENLKNQKSEIEEKLREFKDARIIADGTTFPGVRVHFGIIYKEIEEAVKTRKFMLDSNSIVMVDWKPDSDAK